MPRSIDSRLRRLDRKVNTGGPTGQLLGDPHRGGKLLLYRGSFDGTVYDPAAADTPKHVNEYRDRFSPLLLIPMNGRYQRPE